MKNKVISLLFVLFIVTFSTYSQDKIKKAEPPFWWTGFQNTELQLLIYGENIAGYEVIIKDNNIQLAKVHKVENPNYLFLDIDISNATAGKFDIVFQTKGKTKITYSYELKERLEGSSQIEGFNNSDVIYLITPDRFANGNPANDDVDGYPDKANRFDPDGRHGGDIQGMIDHLDYIKELGFTSVWVNPVLENNQLKYSYHGYSTTDFYKVDGRYGSNEEYKKLVQACADKNMKFIMDMIINHCGSEHWWMKDLPSKNWINYEGEFIPTNHKRTTIQDMYASEEDKKRFSDGWFVKTMPDLNQKNPFMAKYLIQNTIWWVEYLALSGIRMDTYPYPDAQFMADWTKEVMAEYPNFNIVGEEWSTNPAIVSYWQKGKKNQNGYVSHLPSVMDFPLQNALKEGLIEEETWGTGFIKLYEMLANDFLYADPNNLVIFPDNHDMDRFFTQVNEDFGLFKLGLAYLLTTRGIPQIYYGTEILMENTEVRKHGYIRSDFPGGWENDSVNVFTKIGMTDQQIEALDFCKTLIRWRKNKKVIHNGDLMHYAPVKGVYILFRYDENEKVMVILNKNEEATSIKFNRFYELLDGVTKGIDIISKKSFDMTTEIELPAKAPLILELE